MKKKWMKGFTLIELLITLLIICILAATAYPTYQSYIVSSRRTDAKSSLLNMANLMERYYSLNNTYVGATLANLGLANPTPQGYYNLQITSAAATTYTLTGVPIGAQATNDTTCASFTLNQLGQMGITGTGVASTCWGN